MFNNTINIDIYFPNSTNKSNKFRKSMILGYVYEEMTEFTVPLYEYYHTEHDDHLTTLAPNIIYNHGEWIRIAPPIVGYVYPNN